jgi:hypothetical protein
MRITWSRRAHRELDAVLACRENIMRMLRFTKWVLLAL